jgi:hypothetical protein
MPAIKCGGVILVKTFMEETNATHVIPAHSIKICTVATHLLDVNLQLAASGRAPQTAVPESPITKPQIQAVVVDHVRTRQYPVFLSRPDQNFKTHLAS